MKGARMVLLAWLCFGPLAAWAGECRTALVVDETALAGDAGVLGILTGALAQEPSLACCPVDAGPGPLNLEAAAARGRESGAELVLLVQARGGRYRLEAELVEVASGRIVATPGAEGAADRAFDLVDGLGASLAEALTGGRAAAGRVAVLDFANGAAAEYAPFVRGLPDMLATGLAQTEGVALIDKAEIAAGRAEGALLPGGEGGRAAAQLGQRLGAAWVVRGSFAEVVDLQTRLLVVRTGQVLDEAAISATRPQLPDQAARVAAALAAKVQARRQGQHQVAVLNFENHAAEEYGGFVCGLADMLMTNLGQAEGLVVIERVQIERALQNLALELSGPINTEQAVEIGQWLGADEVVLGGFTRFGDTFRIDARVISTRTGELLTAQNVRGSEAEVMGLVDQLGGLLAAGLAEKRSAGEGGTGELLLQFMIAKAEMGERVCYRHLCKLYVDGRFAGLSPVIGQGETWSTLFRKRLPAGRHEVQVVHGFVREGAWDGQMPNQPHTFALVIEPNQVTALQYSYLVGWFSEEFRYGPPWR